MVEIKFKRDTSFRKQFFVPDSFAHPAKMDAQLLIWIVVGHYTAEGETILDPMAGSGTTMLACTLGRNCILVELEEKFCKMMRDNWNEVKMRPQLGSKMGGCQIIQGDARQLEGLVDKIVTSPPYAETEATQRLPNIPTSKGLQTKYEPQSSENNIGNLPYGEIDKCIFSPPYAEADSRDERPHHQDGELARMMLSSYVQTKQGKSEGQISNLPYGQIDKIVTSPPYEAAVSASTGGERDMASARQREKRLRDKGYDPKMYQGGAGHNLEVDFQYTKDKDNIGNLKSDSYLEAMLQVYQQCYSVLKPQGLMILVTKNFIRNKQVVRLDTDTIKLCEQAGFNYLERHYRKLEYMSFWRVIYHQKHPEVEQILNEDVLVFTKCAQM